MVSHANSYLCLVSTGKALQEHAVSCGICLAQAQAAVGCLINAARKAGPTPALFEVAVQEGCCGYLDAVRRYRPSTGTPFCAFACHHIKGAVMRGVGRELEPLCPNAVAKPEAVESLPMTGAYPGSESAAIDACTAVSRFVRRLPRGLRCVARAVALDGLSQAHAARASGLSRTTVMKKMRKVRGLALVELAEFAPAN